MLTLLRTPGQALLEFGVEPVFQRGWRPSLQEQAELFPPGAVFSIKFEDRFVLLDCEGVLVDGGIEVVEVSFPDLLAGAALKVLGNLVVRQSLAVRKVHGLDHSQ